MEEVEKMNIGGKEVVLSKISELLPLELVQKSATKAPLTKEEYVQSLTDVLVENQVLESKNAENFVSNYIYISRCVQQDLVEIKQRIQELKKLGSTIPDSDVYYHKKIRYFLSINQKALDEVVEFMANRMVQFALDTKAYKYLEREDDQLTMLFLDFRYDYAQFKKYYDIDYDYSTETKIRFLPGITLENMQQSVEKYIQLHKSNPENYAKQIDKMVSDNKCVEFICEKVKNTYQLFKRAETFDVLVELYNAKRYQTFISLAVIQLEGIFYDCCTILNQRTEQENFGTLIEKADKVFSENIRVKQAIYPHYAFTIPNLRNQIAHKGFIQAENLFHQANELMLDLYTIVYWCGKLERDKFYSIYEAFSKCTGDDVEEDKVDSKILCTLFSCYQCFDREFLQVLAKPNNYDNELSFYKSNAPTPDTITIKEMVDEISTRVKTEDFWKMIATCLDDVEQYDPSKPYDFVDFILKLRDVIIPVLTKDTPEKLACQDVSKKLKEIQKKVV